MDRKFVIESLTAAGSPVAGNISNAKLEALAIEKGIPLTNPDAPEVVPNAPEEDSALDDITWRVAAGLSYEQAVEASARQKAADAAAE